MRLVTCFIKIEEEVHCVGAGLVPARTAACCGPPGGHKGRPYEGERPLARQSQLGHQFISETWWVR